MLIQTRGIVLHRQPYNDRYHIVHLYTEAQGRLGILLSTNRTNKKDKVSRALIPLSEIEIIGEVKKGGNLMQVKEIKLINPNISLQLHPSKNSQSIFISELLYRVLSQKGLADRDLYQFLSTSFIFFDHAEQGLANFYLCFAYHLLYHLAIEPSIDKREAHSGAWFDLSEALFTFHPKSSSEAIPPHWCAYLYTFSRITYGNMHYFRYNREQRAIIIDSLMLYYQLHLPYFGQIKSLEVLRRAARGY